MGIKMEIQLPYSRETTGTVIYAVARLESMPVGQVYVRKESLVREGHTGPWPTEVTLTVQFPDAPE